MLWQDLTTEVDSAEFAGERAEPLTGVEYDSRRVKKGSLFVAMKGGSTDGNQFISKAIHAGAGAIITDSTNVFDHLLVYHPGLPLIRVDHGRRALAEAAACFFSHPERTISATGITGTNGKTTTAFLTEALLNAASRKTVLIGTIEYHIAGQTRPSLHTTPESRDLFELLAAGASLGATELVTEVSSHALDQGRVYGIPFDVAVFTNLTRDHLDYHKTMANYFAAKKLLFDGSRYPAPRVAVINTQDDYAYRFISAAKHVFVDVRTYGIHSGDWCAEDVKLIPSGAEFTLKTPFGSARVNSHLAGPVNVLNLLAAAAAAHARGMSFQEIAHAVQELKPVPGRFQLVNAGQCFTVIVDYAHTDDALRNLTALAQKMKPTPEARVITVFGCGGDRDRSKRPRMGRAAGEGSNLAIVTSDNPRSEDPSAIIDEILPGLQQSGVKFLVEPDRAAAIRLAISEAHPGDIVLLAGKGHEREQTLANSTIPFDDSAVAYAALTAQQKAGSR